MNILITGARGFAGKNLVDNLKNIRDNKNRTRPGIQIDNIYEYDTDNEDADLMRFCLDADIVFNFAGVNRPKDETETFNGNSLFITQLTNALLCCNNRCPIVYSSSVQASLTGRFAESAYGQSKLDAENLLFDYSKKNDIPVYIFRFPNLFGKFCRPNYNSAVATFCHNIANDLPITVNDPSTELELLYIDDLVDAMFDILEGKVCRCEYNGLQPVGSPDGKFCYIPNTHKVTLGKITELLYNFNNVSKTLLIPEIPAGSFEKKLYSTYLSYLPREKVCFPLKMNTDARGSFTELLKTEKCGQFSVNISDPGITKGEHWHNSKWEFFIVVSGRALIRERKIGSEEIFEFEVSGDDIKAVQMLPGYTHNIINLSQTEKLITIMWANEKFDPDRPDTFGEKV